MTHADPNHPAYDDYQTFLRDTATRDTADRWRCFVWAWLCGRQNGREDLLRKLKEQGQPLIGWGK